MNSAAVLTPGEMSDTLLAAEDDRRAIQPFTANGHPDLDLDLAYAAQAALVQKKVARGDDVVGVKLGLTSRAKQQAMGVEDPLYGVATASMLVPYGRPIDLGSLIQPRVGHPAESVAWVINQMGARGRRLPAGSLVFSGGLTAPIPLRGDVITAEFDGLGAVEVCGKEA